MTLEELTDSMKSYNRTVAYGSECNAWQDYLQDIRTIYGVSALDDRDEEIDVSQESEAYWMDVAKGESDDYHPKTGANSRLPDCPYC